MMTYMISRQIYTLFFYGEYSITLARQTCLSPPIYMRDWHLVAFFRVVVVLAAPHPGGGRTRQHQQSKVHTISCFVSPSHTGLIEASMLMHLLVIILLLRYSPPKLSSCGSHGTRAPVRLALIYDGHPRCLHVAAAVQHQPSFKLSYLCRWARGICVWGWCTAQDRAMATFSRPM